MIEIPAHMLDIALMLAETSWLPMFRGPDGEERDEVLETWARAREAIRRGEPVAIRPDPELYPPAPTSRRS